MRVPIAREGYPFIFSTAIPAIVLLDAAVQFGGPFLWGFAAAISALAIGVIGFFRDPERSGPKGTDLILSPADGKIIEITTVNERSFLGGTAVRLSIFLSLFDVLRSRSLRAGLAALGQPFKRAIVHGNPVQRQLAAGQSDRRPRSETHRELCGRGRPRSAG